MKAFNYKTSKPVAHDLVYKLIYPNTSNKNSMITAWNTGVRNSGLHTKRWFYHRFNYDILINQWQQKLLKKYSVLGLPVQGIKAVIIVGVIRTGLSTPLPFGWPPKLNLGVIFAMHTSLWVNHVFRFNYFTVVYKLSTWCLLKYN